MQLIYLYRQVKGPISAVFLLLLLTRIKLLHEHYITHNTLHKAKKTKATAVTVPLMKLQYLSAKPFSTVFGLHLLGTQMYVNAG